MHSGKVCLWPKWTAHLSKSGNTRTKTRWWNRADGLMLKLKETVSVYNIQNTHTHTHTRLCLQCVISIWPEDRRRRGERDKEEGRREGTSCAGVVNVSTWLAGGDVVTLAVSSCIAWKLRKEVLTRSLPWTTVTSFPSTLSPLPKPSTSRNFGSWHTHTHTHTVWIYMWYINHSAGLIGAHTLDILPAPHPSLPLQRTVDVMHAVQHSDLINQTTLSSSFSTTNSLQHSVSLYQLGPYSPSASRPFQLYKLTGMAVCQEK